MSVEKPLINNGENRYRPSAQEDVIGTEKEGERESEVKRGEKSENSSNP